MFFIRELPQFNFYSAGAVSFHCVFSSVCQIACVVRAINSKVVDSTVPLFGGLQLFSAYSARQVLLLVVLCLFVDR